MARDVTAAAGAGNVTFTLAELPSSGMTEPFDLWFSNLVLQHNPPPVMALVLQRAFASLAPGGVALLQVPTYAWPASSSLQHIWTANSARARWKPIGGRSQWLLFLNDNVEITTPEWLCPMSARRGSVASLMLGPHEPAAPALTR